MLVGCAILGSLPVRIRKFPMGTWARNGRWIGGAILVWHGGEPSTLPAAGPSALFAFPPRPPTLGALEPGRSCRGARAPVGTPSRWGPEHLLGVRGVLLVAARGPGRGIFVVARAGPQTRGYQNRTPVKPWGPGTMPPPPPLPTLPRGALGRPGSTTPPVPPSIII